MTKVYEVIGKAVLYIAGFALAVYLVMWVLFLVANTVRNSITYGDDADLTKVEFFWECRTRAGYRLGFPALVGRATDQTLCGEKP